MSQMDLEKSAAATPLTEPVDAEQLPLFARDTLDEVKKEEPAWRREATKRPPWKSDFTTVSGMETNPMATPLSVADQDWNEIGWPGEFPYTRGIHPAGYRGRLWTMRQFAGFGTAADTNERFKYLLAHGQTGLST